MKCPFCAEDIQPNARKCKHCGEWLDGKPANTVDASAQARAVAKGIKKQKQDEATAGCFSFLGLFFGVVVGVSIGGATGFWIGVVFFLGFAIYGAMKYHKE